MQPGLVRYEVHVVRVISYAYLAEIYRGGLAAVAKGQWEASAALGMPRSATLTRVIGPQVGRSAGR